MIGTALSRVGVDAYTTRSRQRAASERAGAHPARHWHAAAPAAASVATSPAAAPTCMGQMECSDASVAQQECLKRWRVPGNAATLPFPEATSCTCTLPGPACHHAWGAAAAAWSTIVHAAAWSTITHAAATDAATVSVAAPVAAAGTTSTAASAWAQLGLAVSPCTGRHHVRHLVTAQSGASCAAISVAAALLHPCLDRRAAMGQAAGPSGGCCCTGNAAAAAAAASTLSHATAASL